MSADTVVRELKKLSIYVRLLIVLSAVNLIGIFLAFSIFDSSAPTDMSSFIEDRGVYDPWDDLTIIQKIERSSVAFITHNVREGSQTKAVIHEFLKYPEGVNFPYAVGDEFAKLSRLNRPDRPNTEYGDGELVLLDGSPADIRETYAIYDGRLPGLGDISLAQIEREMKKE